ncbi:MAG TPA: hypothetical protein PLX03_06190 [Candidatus Hydrogenedentes bacterium]|nr:hypothetical protein [Candidatus Hydrogenedentota bacterium]
MKPERTGSRLYAAVITVGVSLILVMAGSGADVVVSLENGVPASPGATSEVSVSLDWTDDTPPSTLILGIGYDRTKVTPDAAWFEVIQRNRSGQPIREPDGTVRVNRQPVMPAAQLQEAGKSLDFNVIDAVEIPDGEGALLVAIAGGKDPIPRGAMLTLAFRAAADLYGTVTLRGLDTDHPAFYGDNPPLVSSAADSSGNGLFIVVQQGSLSVNGCVPASAAMNVSATTDRRDGVMVTWTPETGMEYRVFRRAGSDGAYLPLGTEWVQGGSFLDESAPWPAGAGGCLSSNLPPVVSSYQVVARDRVARCPVVPSGEGVQGSRAVGSLFSMLFSCGKRLVGAGQEPPVVLAAPVILLIMRRRRR